MSMTKITEENWVMGASRDSRVTSPGQSQISRGMTVLSSEEPSRAAGRAWTSSGDALEMVFRDLSGGLEVEGFSRREVVEEDMLYGGLSASGGGVDW